MGPLVLTPSLLHSDLVDETTRAYIRSISFSPDGKSLATGSEDGVRVSSRIFISAIVIVVIIVFEADAQHRMIFGALDLGHRREADPQRFPGSHPVYQLGRFLVGREIAHLWVELWYGDDLGYDGWVVEDPCNYRRCWWSSMRGYQL